VGVGVGFVDRAADVGAVGLLRIYKFLHISMCITAETMSSVECSFAVKLLTERLGHAVALLVEALHYKPEGRGSDSRRCHWISFIGIILPPALGSWGRLSL